MSTTSPATDRALPAVTPSVLALLLSAGVFLATAGRTLVAAGSAPGWWAAWIAAAVIALLASFRHALPAGPGPVGGGLWLVAGVCGAALLGRHAVDSLIVAWADFPADESTLPFLDLGDTLLLVALVVPAIVQGMASRLRAQRPALLLPTLFGLIPLLVVMVPFLSPSRLGNAPPSPTWGGLDPLLVPLALLWATTLVGPAALPLSSRRAIAHHWAPRLLSSAALAGIPALLLALGGIAGVQRAGGVPLALPGRKLFGTWGFETGAGLEVAVALGAAWALIVLCARVAARSLPRLRSGIFFVLALAAALTAAWTPLPVLLAVSGGVGWLAVLWGTEPEGAGPPPLVDA